MPKSFADRIPAGQFVPDHQFVEEPLTPPWPLGPVIYARRAYDTQERETQQERDVRLKRERRRRQRDT